MKPPLLPGHRWPRLAGAAAILGILALMAVLPARPNLPLPSQCAIRSLTGLPCPLCGGTRATRALLHGDVNRALQLNALALPALIVLAGGAALLGWEGVRGRPVMDWKALGARLWKWAPWVAVLLVAWWIPQLAGALSGTKAELMDGNHPVARLIYQKIHGMN